MSIKTKMQSLIDAANAKTCKGDTDLTTAVQSLISESGGITPSGNKAITATTSTLTDIDVTNYATVSVAPTPSEAIVVTTNGDATPSSGKLLSKVTVNVPTGEARDASDITVSGATVNVPAGLYSSAASKSVASGTAGTPTASKGAVSNNSVTVTPSVANTEGYITGGTKTGTGVKVSASELVSGNKALTPSETAQSGIDVTNFKTVSVDAISSTYVGSGVTKKAAATVAPSTSEQTVCASGVYTTGEQKVSAITPSIVGNLDASSFASSIVAAIEGKGVTVPNGAKIDDLAEKLAAIATADNIVHGDIPDYIKAAALEVAKKVRAVQTEESITFIAMSDSHQLDTSSDIVTGNLHAGMAAKAIAYIMPNIDFACFLGDYTAGSNTTTIEEGKRHFAEINADIDEAFSGIPQFRTVGNHDDLHYSQTQNGRTLTKEELFQYIGSYNDGTVDPDNPEGGYCYRDFEDKHLRVICLNTSDYLSSGAITDTQLKWFAQTALDFSGKASPSDWSFLVLGHHPMDWVVTPALVLKAYIDGTTYSSSTWSKNFSGANQAAFIGNFHGHIHNFKTGKLHYRYNTSTTPVTTKEFNAMRVAIPNMCFARNNEYGHNSGPEVDDIEYGENTTYNKTAGTAQDTALCVLVVDRASKIIHAFCYGAGIDREVSYDFTLASYSVTSTLSHVTSSNSTLSVTEGSSYYAELTPEDGYALDSVTVTMGGADITATAYGDGVVSIGAVTGNIVITATAAKVIVSTDLIAEYGYRDGYRMSTSTGNFSAGARYVAIGYPNAIPVGVADYPSGFVIEVTGANFNSSAHSNCTWAIYQGTDPTVTSGTGGYIRAGTESLNGVSTTVELTENGIKWTFPVGLPSYTFLRFAGYGSGANLTGTITPNA